MSLDQLKRAAPDLLVAVAKPFKRIASLCEASKEPTISRSESGRVANLRFAVDSCDWYTHRLNRGELDLAELPVRECEIGWTEIQALNFTAVQSRGWRDVFDEVLNGDVPRSREALAVLQRLDRNARRRRLRRSVDGRHLR